MEESKKNNYIYLFVIIIYPTASPQTIARWVSRKAQKQTIMKTTIILILSAFLFFGCSKDESIEYIEVPVSELDCYNCRTVKNNSYGYPIFCNTQEWIDKWMEKMRNEGYVVSCEKIAVKYF